MNDPQFFSFSYPGRLLKPLLFGLAILGGVGLSTLSGQIRGVDFEINTVTRESSLGQKQVVATFP